MSSENLKRLQEKIAAKRAETGRAATSFFQTSASSSSASSKSVATKRPAGYGPVVGTSKRAKQWKPVLCFQDNEDAVIGFAVVSKTAEIDPENRCFVIYRKNYSGMIDRIWLRKRELEWLVNPEGPILSLNGDVVEYDLPISEHAKDRQMKVVLEPQGIYISLKHQPVWKTSPELDHLCVTWEEHAHLAAAAKKISSFLNNEAWIRDENAAFFFATICDHASADGKGFNALFDCAVLQLHVMFRFKRPMSEIMKLCGDQAERFKDQEIEKFRSEAEAVAVSLYAAAGQAITFVEQNVSL